MKAVNLMPPTSDPGVGVHEVTNERSDKVRFHGFHNLRRHHRRSKPGTSARGQGVDGDVEGFTFPGKSVAQPDHCQLGSRVVGLSYDDRVGLERIHETVLRNPHRSFRRDRPKRRC